MIFRKQKKVRAQQMLSQLYFYYMDHVDELPQESLNFLDAGEKVSRVVCDYIAGMSDIYAIDQFEKIIRSKTLERTIIEGSICVSRNQGISMPGSDPVF